jgi:hypothetical protein
VLVDDGDGRWSEAPDQVGPRAAAGRLAMLDGIEPDAGRMYALGLRRRAMLDGIER